MTSGSAASILGTAQPVGARLTTFALALVTFVVTVVGSMGAPLLTRVALDYGVSTAAAQWTLTITLLTGCVATPVLGRLAAGPRRRSVLLVTLLLVAVGSAISLSPPFAALLIGRAIQGVGLGLPSLMMAVARDALAIDEATNAVSVISVVATFGIGIGYPLAGWLVDLGGLHAAYLFGLAVTLLAVAVTARCLPATNMTTSARVDLRSLAWLTPALSGLLISVGEPSLWNEHPLIGAAILVLALGLASVWTRHELGSRHPLVDVQMLRRPAVLVANGVTFLGGIGIYLLQTIVLRYLQTPPSAGYGFGATTFVASLALIPFALFGYLGRLVVPRLLYRVSRDSVLIASTVIGALSCACFAALRSHLAEPMIAISILGIGVSGFAVIVPRVLMDHVELVDTATAMGANQVIRTLGYAVGSAAAGLVLAAPARHRPKFPTEAAYTHAAELGVVALVVTLAVTMRFRHALRETPSSRLLPQ